jgi:DNA-binding NtrC family response regulator
MKHPARILVVDDDESITTTIAAFLSAKAYDVTVANDGDDALIQARQGHFDIVISDIYIDRVTGLDVLDAVRKAQPRCAVILMTARGSVRTTVEAEVKGAFDYIAKPFDMGALLTTVKRAETYLESVEQPKGTPEEDLEPFGNMIGFSPAMIDVYKNIARSAHSNETVLIVGETGVGKELVARAIHDHSPRARAPFIAVDSGAVPGTLWESELFGAVRGAFTGADRDRPGVVESARGGTVFLDEVGEIPLDFQPKLLRFLQEREFRPVGAGSPRKSDVRVIAATNRNLPEMVQNGEFRDDLYYVLRIAVPSLRERRSDIDFLVRRFLGDALGHTDKRIWLTPEAESALREYSWLGNVRELRNVVQRLVTLSPPGPIGADTMRSMLATAMDLDELEPSGELAELERRQILRVLEETGGNKSKAAEILGIQRRTLYKKLARIERDSQC